MRTIGAVDLYVERMGGNRGDALILEGLWHVLSKCSCRRIAEPADSGWILVNGGDSINDIWMRGIAKLEELRSGNPAAPIVVAPSSYRFNTVESVERMRNLMSETGAPIHLFAREQYSYEALRSLEPPPHVTINLSQDLAFELAGSPFVHEWRQKARTDYLLVSMRTDKQTSIPALRRLHRINEWLAPKSHIIERVLFRSRMLLTRLCWRPRVRRILDDLQLAPSRNAEVRWTDASIAESFEAFCGIIAAGNPVVTDRIHVAIFGYLLEKQVVLVPNSYYKARGLYEQSMKSSHVHLASLEH